MRTVIVILYVAFLLALAQMAPGQITVLDTVVPEGTTTSWPIDFEDEEGDPVVPGTAVYMIATAGDIEHAGVTLIASTSITPLASSVVVQAAAMTVPNLNLRNPNLPASADAVFTVYYTWPGDGGTKSRVSSATFTLGNEPNWPFP